MSTFNKLKKITDKILCLKLDEAIAVNFSKDELNS